MNSVIVTEKSSNKKLSLDQTCSTTYVSQETCPSNCPLHNNGCYAESSFTGIFARKLNASNETNVIKIAQEEADGIRTLTGTRSLRLHTLGDAPNDECVKILAKAAKEYRAKNGQPVFTYTHNHITPRKDWGEISILRSCEDVESVRKCNSEGFAAAMIVPEFKKHSAYHIDGVKFVPCPQQTKKAESCVKCRLCMNDKKLLNSNVNILFATHGNKKNQINRNLKTV